jgi:3D (Asp-Asp-Asp) domain-containing protein
MSRRSALPWALVVALLVPATSASAKPLTKPTWLSRTSITEYFPVPESWFDGKAIAAPGIPGKHRVDWLYSARGLSMEGDGVGLDGRRYHIESTGSTGWINAAGKRTKPTKNGWSHGRPFWRAGGYWRNTAKQPTYPLASGGWFAGVGRALVAVSGITFGSGPSRPLQYYASVAVDPELIPLGSRIWIPAYKGVGGSNGWFVAADVGGAIQGRHLDVYRPAPGSPEDSGNALDGARVRVYPPGTGGQLPRAVR